MSVRSWRSSLGDGRLPLGAVFGLGLGLLMLMAVGSALWLSIDAAIENTTTLMRDKVDLVAQASEDRVTSYLDPVEETGRFLLQTIQAGEVLLDDRTALALAMRMSLAGSPQIQGIAFLYNDLSLVRVGRREDQTRFADWSRRPDVAAGIEALKDAREPGWLPPLWTELFQDTLLVYHLPVEVKGEIQGTLLLVIATRDLSEDISEVAYAGTTPFILYGRDHVLAHPLLIHGFRGSSQEDPLPTLAQVGDPVLAEMWSREREPLSFLLPTHESGHILDVGGEPQIFVYRTLNRYGKTPWLVGLHVPGAIGAAEITRLTNIALISGLLLIIAVIAAIFIGRGMGRPLIRLADAASRVSGLDLAKVPRLPHSPIREIDVAANSFNSMVSALRWFEVYTPKALVHRLLTNDQTITAAQEQDVTVMFTDIVGFTGIASRLGPAGTADFLNAHFSQVGACIDATEGTIDKYIGDSVMAFWGAPGSQPNHAERGARAALLLAQKLTQNSASDEPVRVRIGLSSGRGLVGNIGAPGRINYTVVGEVVNLAQRFEQLGKDCAPDDPVTILITEQTAKALPDSFRPEAMGSYRIRGMNCMVEVYRLPLE
ncbi:class 3 adenylate cyclase/HAMP domain-containing protein [Rhodoligotrophos appendicifer]|uniref:adenylate/guanylate cyclase domain-containing protein n=1 Tax=Rhodoligotrophos appendicifer TaxID=987056 RepID=UPI0011847A19|nr:adenylate/guanylate cyclase domain-containing protein [Rhodoligotrophos appendicifer]